MKRNAAVLAGVGLLAVFMGLRWLEWQGTPPALPPAVPPPEAPPDSEQRRRAPDTAFQPMDEAVARKLELDRKEAMERTIAEGPPMGGAQAGLPSRPAAVVAPANANCIDDFMRNQELTETPGWTPGIRARLTADGGSYVACKAYEAGVRPRDRWETSFQPHDVLNDYASTLMAFHAIAGQEGRAREYCAGIADTKEVRAVIRPGVDVGQYCSTLAAAAKEGTGERCSAIRDLFQAQVAPHVEKSCRALYSGDPGACAQAPQRIDCAGFRLSMQAFRANDAKLCPTEGPQAGLCRVLLGDRAACKDALKKYAQTVCGLEGAGVLVRTRPPPEPASELPGGPEPATGIR